MKQISPKQNAEILKCYHCGEDCLTDKVSFDDKFFCCTGCRTVYDLLKECDLCTYYSLNANPGLQARGNYYKGKYDHLDSPEVKRSLIRFEEGHIAHVVFYVPGIHCSSCIWLLENLHRLHRYILSSKVDFLQKEVTIIFDPGKVALSHIAELMARTGYEPAISLKDAESKKTNTGNRKTLAKIGLSGFCFGNIMMMSFPEYFASGDFYDQQQLKYFFSYLNLALSLPVLFYCAAEFFISGWKGLVNRHLNIDAPIALAILVTFVRSLYEIISGTGPGYLDSMSGIVFFMLIGRYFQNRTYGNLSFDRDYKSYFPLGVTVNRNGTEVNVPASTLTKGDRIIIRNNELVPADARLLSPFAHFDYSFITGESALIKKVSGDDVYAGARQSGGLIELEVIQPTSQSYLTRLWNNSGNKPETSKDNGSFTDRINQYFTIAVLVLAAASALFWLWADSSRSLGAFTAVLIVACPCGLLLTSTFANGNLLRIFGRNKFYLRNSGVIEKLTKTDTIVFDKTGTITSGSTVEFVGEKLNAEEISAVYTLASQSAHPLSVRIGQFYRNEATKKVIEHFEELPGLGIKGRVLNKQVLMGSDFFVIGKTVNSAEMTTRVYVSIDEKVKGWFSFRAIYRPGLQQLARQLSLTHSLKVISGDNQTEKNNLAKIFGPDTELLFNQKPHDKKKNIIRMQAQGHRVIMIGDGLNDAGALMQSDVGIAVSDNTNTFSPACDAIIDGKSLVLLDRFIDLAAAGRRIILVTFAFSLIYNITGLFFAVQGTLSPVIAAILMPASTLSIVLLTTLFTGWAARKRGL